MPEPAAGRVLSGMRPTGHLHLGHHLCVLSQWQQLQRANECFFFVADWHALTTGGAADAPGQLSGQSLAMVTAWLAAGIDPDRSVIYVQSALREPAELALLLAMICPLPWAERVPTFRDYCTSKSRDEISVGFLGYPILQAADILMHSADHVPVGEDQLPHIEFARELARRFNELFGKDAGWQEQSDACAAKLSDQAAFDDCCRRYQQGGDEQARHQAIEMIAQAQLGGEQKQRLAGRIEGSGREILKPPAPLVAPVAKMPGLDGRKMSKSYGNDIGMLEPRSSFEPRLLKMPTDPARVRRTDPGDPKKCPVWPLHEIFSDAKTCSWVEDGCKSAAIGCRDCKAALADHVERHSAPLIERAEPWLAQPQRVAQIIEQGNARAKDSAAKTMAEVRQAVGLCSL